MFYRKLRHAIIILLYIGFSHLILKFLLKLLVSIVNKNYYNGIVLQMLHKVLMYLALCHSHNPIDSFYNIFKLTAINNY